MELLLKCQIHIIYTDHDTVLVSILITQESESMHVLTNMHCNLSNIGCNASNSTSRSKHPFPTTNEADSVNNKRTRTDSDVQIIEQLSQSFCCSHPNFLLLSG